MIEYKTELVSFSYEKYKNGVEAVTGDNKEVSQLTVFKTWGGYILAGLVNNVLEKWDENGLSLSHDNSDFENNLFLKRYYTEHEVSLYLSEETGNIISQVSPFYDNYMLVKKEKVKVYKDEICSLQSQ